MDMMEWGNALKVGYASVRFPHSTWKFVAHHLMWLVLVGSWYMAATRYATPGWP